MSRKIKVISGSPDRRRVILGAWALGGALVLLPAAHALAQDAGAEAGWLSAAPLPESRTEISMTSDGERLYLSGGFAPGNGRFHAPLAVYAFDPLEDSWEVLTDLPMGVNHAPMVYLDGHLYIAGGYSEATFQPIDSFMIYDISADEWQSGPPLPTARGALATTVHDGRIHAIGGVGANGENTGAHEIFDPGTGEWQEAAPLPTPRDHHAAASLGGEIVVPAGRNADSDRLTITEIYDPASDEWRQGADLPTGRSGVAAVALEGRLYLFGGESFAPPAIFDDAERYEPESDSWDILPPMPTARHGLGAAALGGAIHVVSGGPRPGLTYSDAHEVLTFESGN